MAPTHQQACHTVATLSLLLPLLVGLGLSGIAPARSVTMQVSSKQAFLEALALSMVDRVELLVDVTLSDGMQDVVFTPGRLLVITSAAPDSVKPYISWRLLDFAYHSDRLHLSHNNRIIFKELHISGTRTSRLLSYPGIREFRARLCT
jgi:hypothetical protein